MKTSLLLFVPALFVVPPEALPQERPEAALYRKCDSEIPWISDGIELKDNLVGGRPPQEPPVDRAALLDRARKLAAEKNRLILWYCFRVPGTHMYRARLLDQYMKVAIFTDPSVVDLIKARFVPLRMAADDKTGFTRGIRAFDYVEPGLVVMTPDGKVVHGINRIRTFNPSWVRAALVAVLRANPDFNAPLGDSIDDLIRGGNDDKALEKAEGAAKAAVLRRIGRPEESIRIDGASPLDRGLSLFALGRFEEARPLLEKEEAPEALYALAAIDNGRCHPPEPRWKALLEKHPGSPWAWRAAANLVPGPDTRPDGPLAHFFEDLQVRALDGLPSSTRKPAADLAGASRRAVEFLLRAQRADGAWNDARYAYWPDPRIQPNFFMAVTALAARALSEWREVEPARVDRALSLAEAYMDDDRRLNRGHNEECYADAYRVFYWAAKKDIPRMNRLVVRLAAQIDPQGFWAHEYPNPFATAAVVHSLDSARKAGAEVPDALFRKAAQGLLKTRGPGGRQTYGNEPPPSGEKDSAGRTAMCELALHECGKATLQDVAAGIDVYWKHHPRLDKVRACDFHSDGELAGFFYFYDLFHTTEAVLALPESDRPAHLRKIREQVLSLPEIDGSFLDSHELGKSYGTAMALLVMRRAK
jgi:hypothetical protein